MADTSTDSLTCSLAPSVSSGELPTSQTTYNNVVSKQQNLPSFNTGRYNADPISSTDSSVVYSIQAIYSFNSDALIIEATV